MFIKTPLFSFLLWNLFFKFDVTYLELTSENDPYIHITTHRHTFTYPCKHKYIYVHTHECMHADPHGPTHAFLWEVLTSSPHATGPPAPCGASTPPSVPGDAACPPAPYAVGCWASPPPAGWGPPFSVHTPHTAVKGHGSLLVFPFLFAVTTRFARNLMFTQCVPASLCLFHLYTSSSLNSHQINFTMKLFFKSKYLLWNKISHLYCNLFYWSQCTTNPYNMYVMGPVCSKYIHIMQCIKKVNPNTHISCFPHTASILPLQCLPCTGGDGGAPWGASPWHWGHWTCIHTACSWSWLSCPAHCASPLCTHGLHKCQSRNVT